MPLGSTAELDYMLADCGVAVTYNGTTVYGLLDVVELDALTDHGVQAGERDIRVGIRNGALAGLVEDAAIVVNGSAYTIRSVGPALATGLRRLRLAPSTAAPSPLLYKRAAGDALPPGSTIVRNSVATYSDANGVLQTAQPNVLRDNHYIGGVRTQLVESQRTNKTVQSAAFDDAAWSKSGATVTPNTALAPDGTSTADTLNFGGANFYVYEFASGLAGVQVTHSCWLSGTGQVALGIYDNVAGFQVALITLTGTLTRYAATFTYGAGATDMRFLVGRIGAATATACTAWGSQLETAAFAETYVPTTTTAVTRPADVLTIPGVNTGGATATLYQKYYDLATAAWVETVAPYSSTSNLPRVADRAYALDKIALGSLTLAQMQAL